MKTAQKVVENTPGDILREDQKQVQHTGTALTVTQHADAVSKQSISVSSVTTATQNK